MSKLKIAKTRPVFLNRLALHASKPKGYLVKAFKFFFLQNKSSDKIYENLVA